MATIYVVCVFFRCVNCDELVSTSSHLRLIRESTLHHTTLDPAFGDRIDFEPHWDPKYFDNNLVKVGKIFCKQCHADWGIYATYQDVPCCLIKLDNLVVCRPNGRRLHSMKWSDRSNPIRTMFSMQSDMAKLKKNAKLLENILRYAVD